MKDISRNITSTFISCAELSFYIEDAFFKEKLFSKMSALLSGYTVRDAAAINIQLDGLLELLDYGEHCGLIKKEFILFPRKNLLELKLEFIKEKTSQREVGENESVVVPGEKITGHQKIQEPPPVFRDTKPMRYRSSPNKDKILDFIRKSPSARTKEIIDQFETMSGRTVKRNLAELNRDGLIKKKFEDRAVYYYSVDN